MKSWTKWIEDRTGLFTAYQKCSQSCVPAKPCCLGLWPSMILFTFILEVVTGVFLWMYYSPSSQTAWESVYYVQYDVLGGWLLRGMHYHAGQVLLALAGLYAVHMILSRAYRAPRELVFWTVVGMALVAIALLLTGDLLPWTQVGYWSTNVRTKFLLLLPWVGDSFYKLAVGGPDMGHLTLTRFTALHAGVFSAVFAVLLGLHGWLARKAAAADPSAGEAAAPYWPNRALHNMLACGVVLAAILFLVGRNGMEDKWAGYPPGDYLGHELGSPRDPIDAYAAARPDWYFVGLYQFAHYFPGWLKILPIFVVPGLLVLLFLAMPFWSGSKLGHAVNVLLTIGLLAAVAALTVESKRVDAVDASVQASLAGEEEAAFRVRELVRGKGIPVSGALSLVWDDAKTQGPKLFKQHCVSCHDYADEQGEGMLTEKPSAPNLHNFAGVAWLTGYLDPKQISYAPATVTKIDRPKYLGATALKNGEMAKFVKDNLKELKKEVGEKEFQKMIAALASEATCKPGDKPSAAAKQAMEDFTCTDCHRFYDKGKKSPDLTGYASRLWLIGVISDPAHKQFYGALNDRMPAYAKTPDAPDKNILTARQVELLAEWLRGQWFEPTLVAE
jgi:ubiquinol-cytochrome c reductase cytochrome b subunit